MITMRRLLPLLGLASLALVSGCSLLGGHEQAQAENAPAQRAVRVAVAEDANAADGGLEVSGVVKARGQVELAFQVGGQVTDVLVDIGDVVQAGQVLARVDSVPYAAQRDQAAGALSQARATLALYEAGSRRQEIAQAESQVRSAEAVKNQAEADYQRMQQLYAAGVIARQQLDAAESGYIQTCEGLRAAQEQLDIAREGARTEQIDAAKAAVLQAQGALSGAQRQLEYATLRAPADGTIVWRDLEPGMTAGPGKAVLELANLAVLEIEAEVPESKLTAVVLGEVLAASFPALPGVTAQAELTSIAPQAQSSTRGFPIKLRIIDPAESIVPGIVALMYLDGQEAMTGTRIQRRSIVDGCVFVVADGVAHRRTVEVLADHGDMAVVSGIEPGTQVVINGQRFVSDGEQVNIVQALAIDEISGLNGR